MRLSAEPHKIKVYEKIKDGIWCYKDFFESCDATRLSALVQRNVFKFLSLPCSVHYKEKRNFSSTFKINSATTEKLEVWARDRGRMCICAVQRRTYILITILPYLKGGRSLTAANVKEILCAKHNLHKSGKILCFPPVFC